MSAQVYTLPESLVMLTRVIDRLATTIIKQERTTALGIVRQTLTTAIKAAADQPELLSLLRRAFEVFPESAWIANELASALYRAGQFDEAYFYHSQAWQIRQQAAVYREEFPARTQSPGHGCSPIIFATIADHEQRIRQTSTPDFKASMPPI